MANISKGFSVYGNNYFSLKTYIGEKEQTCDAVLQELPAITMSSEWDLSPQAALGEKLDELLNNDFINFLGQGKGVKAMRASDALTSRIFKQSTPPSFDLKFRCYSGQKIGSLQLSSAMVWILFLSLSSPINAECGFSLKNFLDNIGAGADAVADVFKAFSADRKDQEELEKEKKEREEEKKEREEEAKHKKETKGELLWDTYYWWKDFFTSDDKNEPGNTKSGNWYDTLKDDNARKKAEEGNKTLVNAVNSVGNPSADIRLKNPISFGANIFKLRIYPFIFAQALPVFVKNWSVTTSKEWNNALNDHYYYDFTLSCEMDRIPSYATWHTSFFGKK